MKVLAAMSGGVDSSVAAALLVEEGHHVTGVTLRLWDNPTDAGCCSVAEIDDARRVAHVLGIDHLVWTFVDEFDARVVQPYAEAHARGLTPNPCIECNRHLKFGRLLRRATQLGFDAVATGPHARVVDGRLLRGADRQKDQSYVLYVLGQEELARCVFPVGVMTKAEVRAKAVELGLPTAAKPDSQDVCFVTTSGGREALLSSRIPLHPGRVVDATGAEVGRVDALELVTVGQRRGLGTGGGARRYALSVDTGTRTVTVGEATDLLTGSVRLSQLCWVHGPATGGVEVQTSAHGDPVTATFDGATVHFDRPQRRVAPGQSVVLYRGDEVLGGGIAVDG
ncbi:MAG TPA: tRNA 2-thiouridine(34) synthase MnmA [Acidimicrobiales bacterium]|nr:tRNA 2-thiouridine(34) synthase MnmA [Acidimicrobiales bacterium]